MAVRTKRDDESYLCLDNRNGPAIPDELLIPLGLPPGAGRGLQEFATITCSHCQQCLIVNPLRNRERAWCKKCDHYICDRCGGDFALTGVCKPFRFVIEEVQEAADKGRSVDSIHIPSILLP